MSGREAPARARLVQNATRPRMVIRRGVRSRKLRPGPLEEALGFPLMAREELLVSTFVTLVDTLVDDYDIIDFLHALAERCVELLDTSTAGIMLADANGNLRHVACSSEQMRHPPRSA